MRIRELWVFVLADFPSFRPPTFFLYASSGRFGMFLFRVHHKGRCKGPGDTFAPAQELHGVLMKTAKWGRPEEETGMKIKTAGVCEQKKGALQHPFVRITQITVFCEYYMVQKPYVEYITGLLQSAGKTTVGIGSHDVPGRMVVRQDDARRV